MGKVTRIDEREIETHHVRQLRRKAEAHDDYLAALGAARASLYAIASAPGEYGVGYRACLEAIAQAIVAAHGLRIDYQVRAGLDSQEGTPDVHDRDVP